LLPSMVHAEARGSPPQGLLFGGRTGELEKNFTQRDIRDEFRHRWRSQRSIPRGRSRRPGRRDRPVFIVVFVALVVVTVPLAGGKLSRLADVDLRAAPVIVAALAIQVVIVSILPGGDPVLHRALHLLS